MIRKNLGVRVTNAALTVALAAVAGAHQQSPQSSQPAARDLVLLADCSRAIKAQDGSDRAIQACRDAIAAADEAGDRAFSRRAPRRFLGDVYTFSNRWSDALAAYEEALSLAGPSDGQDIHTADILVKMAVAQVNLGDTVRADRNAAAAAKTIEASMKANPDQRQEHVTALRDTLEFHARIKRVRGDPAAAKELERKAAALKDRE